LVKEEKPWNLPNFGAGSFLPILLKFLLPHPIDPTNSWGIPLGSVQN